MPETFRLPIAGEWIETGEWDEIRDPYAGDVFARVPLGRHEDMERATAAAVDAFRAFGESPTHRRVDVLMGIVAGIRDRAVELAETMVRESGKPLRFARAEVDRAVQTFTLGADVARDLGGKVIPVDIQPATEDYVALYRRFPVGPVGAISPFNFPLNLVAHKLSPAFAVGNTVVLKPPMQAPVTSLKLAEICYAAGLPFKALSVIHSLPAVAESLATDERYKVLTFTGSARVGWHLKSVAGRKRVVLELGGNAGAIVHDDADLQWTAERCALGAYAHGGQVCIRVQRLLVHRPIYDRFVERFVAAARSMKWGNPLEEDTIVGPLIDAEAAERVMAWIGEAVEGGAEVLTGGRRHDNIIEPTVLAHTSPEMKVEREEIFGPAVTIRPYDTFEEAIDLANDTEYGLQAGVFTRDVGRIWYAFHKLAVGGVVANDYPTLRVDNYPYGGIKASGFGREGPAFAMEDMTELKALVLNLGR